MTQDVLVRFAPSPTGLLHVGNIRMALINWLYAKNHGGRMMLRLDDTDEERSTEAFADGIKEDLTWLGLTWEEFDRQSARKDRYEAAFERLRESGRLYPCYETSEELEFKRKIRLSQGKPPIYDRAALELTPEEIAKYETEGRTPHWRFKLADGEITWEDLGRGTVSFQAENLSDPVLFREDMKPIYMLASTVDDIDHGITHVIRGEDHVSNTAIMTQICEALGGTPPTFCHLSLIQLASGESLSKRKGSLSIQALRESGIRPMAVNSLLARLGTSDPVQPFLSLDEIVKQFNITKISRATPKFDQKELEALNTRLLHKLPFEVVQEEITALGLSGMDSDIWLILRENIERLEDLKDWWTVVQGPVNPVIEDSAFAEQAADLLPAEPWDRETWQQWTSQLKDTTGRKGKQLFMPIRLALTGHQHGPELADLLPLIGYEKARERLHGKAA